jgi:hypothetical protein
MAEVREERSLGELFGELSQETSTLVRQEVQLAKAEIAQTTRKVGKNIAYLAVGATILYAGFLAFMFAVIIVLAEWLDSAWLGALIVAIVVGAIGAYLVYEGYDKLKQVDLVPERTAETIEDDAEWLKQQVK